MIIDKIENNHLYTVLSANISRAFDYIKSTDLIKLEPGKYKIEDENIFALVQEYDTKNREDCKLEGHFKFIDVQYVISGVELMGISNLKNQRQVSKDLEKDIAFYEGDPNFLQLDTRMFAILFPDDLHMPGIRLEKKSKVKKVVIKVRI